MGEAVWGFGAGRVDLHFLLREACLRFVVSSADDSTALTFLHFRGKTALPFGHTRRERERRLEAQPGAEGILAKAEGTQVVSTSSNLVFYTRALQRLTRGTCL